MLFIFLVGLAGCAVVQESAVDVAGWHPATGESGIFHRVQSGESLWAIAQAYGVDLNVILESNDLAGDSQLRPGRRIFVPIAVEPAAPDTAVASIAQQAPAPVEPMRPKFIRGNDWAFDWPLRGRLLDSLPDRLAGYLGRGVNIKASPGAVVAAARPGKVIFADYLSGYAYTVIIDHGDGLTSVYARNGKILTKLGRMVEKGEDIALVGDAPRNPALYFEIRRDGRTESPLHYLPSGSSAWK